jgi:hypothetical protein
MRGAFAFAVLESGIVMNYYAVDIDLQWSNVPGLLTFDGQLQKLDLPKQFVEFRFYDSRDNGLIIHPRANSSYPDWWHFRLDGTTLEWTKLTSAW